jgi:hypothetical protein
MHREFLIGGRYFIDSHYCSSWILEGKNIKKTSILLYIFCIIKIDDCGKVDER